MQVLSAGALANSLAYVLCTGVIVTVIVALVAWTIGAVLKKARPEDLPEILAGLSQVIGALACFLPWGKWRNVPREAPPAPGAGEGSTGVPVALSPTIAITTGQLTVARQHPPGQLGAPAERPPVRSGTGQ